MPVSYTHLIPWALLVAGCILAIGYIGGTAVFVFALPAQAVGGPDGFVNGIHLLAERLGMGWMLAPMALLLSLIHISLDQKTALSSDQCGVRLAAVT